MKRGKQMNVKSAVYTAQQTEEVKKALEEKHGSLNKAVISKHTNEYVQFDILGFYSKNFDVNVWATIGVGAREHTRPFSDVKRAEIIMVTTKAIDVESDKAQVLSQQLSEITKNPFETEWCGYGDVVNARDDFKELFGYDGFTFVPEGLMVEVSGIGKVEYVVVVPIFKDEMKYIEENGGAAFLEPFAKESKKFLLNVDVRRKRWLPKKRKWKWGKKSDMEDILMSLFDPITEEAANVNNWFLENKNSEDDESIE